MFSVLRRRMSYANVVATLAMVFAMSGGAYAASKYLITSTKQIKPSVLASLKGKAGPAGPAGAQGSAGAAGASGAKGENGTNGKEGAQGKEGAKGATGPGGATGAKGATGATGQTGFTETLPSGKTETGTWVAGSNNAVVKEGIAFKTPISFPIPLAKASLHGFVFNEIQSEEGEFEVNSKEEPGCKGGVGGGCHPSGCAGTQELPVAAPGTLCVYTSSEQRTEIRSLFQPAGLPAPDSLTGAILTTELHGSFSKEGILTAYGTWAVAGS
jgi:hypothetical protein